MVSKKESGRKELWFIWRYYSCHPSRGHGKTTKERNKRKYRHTGQDKLFGEQDLKNFNLGCPEYKTMCHYW